MATLVIKKGNHYSRWFPSFTFSKRTSGLIIFKGDFSYSINSQKDTNKLVGLSNAWHHHKSSIRIGWRWNLEKNCLEIMLIVYENWERKITNICSISSEDLTKNTNFYYSIEFDKAQFSNEDICTVFFGNSKTILKTPKYRFIRYFLFPYFGGINKAPKDFYFKLTRY